MCVATVTCNVKYTLKAFNILLYMVQNTRIVIYSKSVKMSSETKKKKNSSYSNFFKDKLIFLKLFLELVEDIFVKAFSTSINLTFNE